MLVEHARRAACERPKPHRVIPRGRCERCAIGRYRQRDDRRRMAFEHRVGLCLAGSPDRDAAIGAGGRRAPIPEQRDRVDGVGMETKHLLGRIARQRPADRGRNRSCRRSRFARRPRSPAPAPARHARAVARRRPSFRSAATTNKAAKPRSADRPPVASGAFAANRLACHPAIGPQRTPGLSRSRPLAWRSSR